MALLAGSARDGPLTRGAPKVGRTRDGPRVLVRRWISTAVFCTGYPLLAIAIWVGATQGRVAVAALLVACGIVMGFLGWGLLTYSAACDARDATAHADGRGAPAILFVSLYNRAGVIVILLSSYTVFATNLGWPLPESFLGWFALVWTPVFLAFAFPVDRPAIARDDDR